MFENPREAGKQTLQVWIFYMFRLFVVIARQSFYYISAKGTVCYT